MSGATVGLLIGFAFVGTFAALFHHYVVRVAKARAWLTRGARLVDVDAAGEFARHHPREAINIPLEELELGPVPELGDRDRPVVVFAHSWRRGAQAVHDLRQMGYAAMNAAGVLVKETLSADVRSPRVRRQNGELLELAPEG